MKKFTALLFLIFGLVYFVDGQTKRPLNADDYGTWERVSSRSLSPDGRWAYFVVGVPKGDSRIELHELDGTGKHIVPRGTDAEFSFDGNYFLCLIEPQYDTIRALELDEVDEEEHPKDSLLIINLQDGSMEKIARVKSYQMPEEAANVLTIQLEKPEPLEPDTTEEVGEKLEEDSAAVEVAEELPDPSERPGYELVVRSFDGSTSDTLLQTTDYTLVDFGAFVYYQTETEDTLHDDGLYVFDVSKRAATIIDTTREDYVFFEPNRTGNQMMYVATDDSSEADIQYYSAYLYEKGKTKLVADTATPGLPAGWGVSENERPAFMDNDRFMFIGVAPLPKVYEEDSTKLKSEKVNVDIWSWNDPDIQPFQLNNASSDKKKSYTARVLPKGDGLLLLENEKIPSFRLDPEAEHNVVLASSEEPYRKMHSFAYPWIEDYYAIDLKSGDTRLVAEGVGFGADLSTTGNYVAYFYQRDSCWHVYDRIASRDLNVTQEIDAAFYDEEDDHPAAPYPYGSVGWSEKDKRFYIYDRYDIWSIDPVGKEDPVNITAGIGRANNVRYRYYSMNPEETFCPKGEWLLTTFNNETKQEGYARLNNLGEEPTMLVQDDKYFGWARSTEKSNRALVTVEDFQNPADMYWTEGDFNDLKKLSSINPQQSEIKWGTSELTSWTSNHGEELQGIIYKPEDFDPAKKYPMIVYFYERYSDDVNRYYTPGPSRSIVNFSYLVSNDYVVFVPDIVYRDGYPGPSSYDCVIPGVQHMINQGYVDAKRIGIQGQSWGGYQTAYLVTQTDLFAAGFAGAPVSNMTSAYGGIRWGSGLSRQFQYERTQSRIGGTLWDYPERYIENSPVFFADRINTPMLIMHNDEDGAVPWYQGIEYFMALRRLNKPAWMLVYNGEAHNLRKWHNRMDLDQRMYQFFDHYLQDAPAPVWMTEGVPAKVKGKEYGFELSE